VTSLSGVCIALVAKFTEIASDTALQSDGIGELLVLLPAGFMFGLYLIYKGTDKYRKYALVRNTATERIRSMALGRTELEGVARPAEKVLDQASDRFIISDKSESDLITHYRRRSILLMVGGLALSAFCLGFLLWLIPGSLLPF